MFKNVSISLSEKVILTANPAPLQLEEGWAVNGVGRHFSHKFGYGLMDAGAIVDLAMKWPGIGKQVKHLSLVFFVINNVDLLFKWTFIGKASFKFYTIR